MKNNLWKLGIILSLVMVGYQNCSPSGLSKEPPESKQTDNSTEISVPKLSSPQKYSSMIAHFEDIKFFFKADGLFPLNKIENFLGCEQVIPHPFQSIPYELRLGASQNIRFQFPVSLKFKANLDSKGCLSSVNVILGYYKYGVTAVCPTSLEDANFNFLESSMSVSNFKNDFYTAYKFTISEQITCNEAEYKFNENSPLSGLSLKFSYLPDVEINYGPHIQLISNGSQVFENFDISQAIKSTIKEEPFF